MSKENKTFELGLTMAGAVSAGAYTAGVLDFLFQALDEWYEAKARTPDKVPSHDVVIRVISGASAGGICGALALVALAGGKAAVPAQAAGASGTSAPSPGRQRYRCWVKPLYDAWVEKPALVSDSGGPDLLGAGDLASSGPVPSLLDSTLLVKIAQDALQGTNVKDLRYPWLAKDLHLFLTVSNLRGVPYAVPFEDSEEGHAMSLHADRVHYRVAGLGSVPGASPWLDDAGDVGETLELAAVTGQQSGSGAAKTFIQSVLATAAFPVGLASRPLGAPLGYYQKRAWPFHRKGGVYPEPKWPPNSQGKDAYPTPFVAVDGGMLNNEPFELAHWTLMAAPPVPNDRSARTADRGVVMIDPFPEPPAFNPNHPTTLEEIDPADLALLAVVGGLVPSLIDQARFKVEELLDAMDPEVSSRFMVQPKRTLRDGGEGAGKEAEVKPALASALLGAFGGFLARDFRDHDFQLGRRNCQQFLRNALAVTADNKVVDGWPIDSIAPEDRARFEFAEPLKKGDPAEPWRVLIPLVGSAADEVPPPEGWPVMQPAAIDTLMKRVGGRADKVVRSLITDRTANRPLRFLLQAGWRASRDRVLAYIRGVIEQQLIRSGQHGGWADLTSDAERAVFAALADPKWTYRTIAGIARSDPGLAEATVDEVLRRYPGRVYWGPLTGEGEKTVTLDSRKPGWVTRLPGVRQLADWWDTPAIS